MLFRAWSGGRSWIAGEEHKEMSCVCVLEREKWRAGGGERESTEVK